MTVLDAAGRSIEVTSARLAQMIKSLLQAGHLIDCAQKGKVELSFAGNKVRKSITLSD